MQKIITTTLYLLIILAPLTFTALSHELFEFPKFILLLCGTLVITAAWAIHAFQTRDYSVMPTGIKLLSYTVLGVLGTQLLATMFSIHPYTSFWGYYTRFHGGLLTTICYTIIYFATMKWLDTKSTQKLIKISVKTSFLISLIAILEHYNISLTCMIMTGIAHLQNAVNTFTATTACWGTLTNPLNRSFATLGQPNWLAAYLLPNIFFALYLLRTKVLRSKWVGYIVVATLTVALLYTKSRSGFLAFGLSYLTYWLLMIRQFSWPKIKIGFTTYSLLLILTLATLGTPYSRALTSLISKPETVAPIQSAGGTQLENGGTESGDIRKIVWTGALDLVRKHPLLGTGPETFAYTYYSSRPTEHNMTSEWDFLYNKAHNEYLNIAATTGIIGLLAYLAWHYAIATTSLTTIAKSKKVKEEQSDLARALAPVLGASLVGFTITNFFGFSVIPVYLLMVIIAALPTTIRQQAEIKNVSTPYHLAIIALTLIYPILLFYADYLFAKGKTLLDKGQASQAIPYLQKATILRPSLDLYHSYLGEAYAGLAGAASGSSDEAVKAQSTRLEAQAVQEAELTKELNPHHLNYYKSRAKIYLSLATMSGDYNRRAGEELSGARLLAPTDPKLAYNLGLVYTRLNKLTDAEKQLQDATLLKPNYPDPYYALTLLYEQTNQSSKIPALLTTAKENLATYSAQLKAKIEQYTSQQ